MERIILEKKEDGKWEVLKEAGMDEIRNKIGDDVHKTILDKIKKSFKSEKIENEFTQKEIKNSKIITDKLSDGFVIIYYGEDIPAKDGTKLLHKISWTFSEKNGIFIEIIQSSKNAGFVNKRQKYNVNVDYKGLTLQKVMMIIKNSGNVYDKYAEQVNTAFESQSKYLDKYDKFVKTHSGRSLD